jgi:hypothetical protein
VKVSVGLLAVRGGVRALKRHDSVKYSNGEQVRLWDRVKVWEGCHGIVVFSIDSEEYSSEYPKEHWQYLKRGVMIDTEVAGLIYYEEPEEEMELLARGGVPSPEEWAALGDRGR